MTVNLLGHKVLEDVSSLEMKLFTRESAQLNPVLTCYPEKRTVEEYLQRDPQVSVPRIVRLSGVPTVRQARPAAHERAVDLRQKPWRNSTRAVEQQETVEFGSYRLIAAAPIGWSLGNRT